VIPSHLPAGLGWRHSASMNKHRLSIADNQTLERGDRASEGLQRVEVITGVGRRRRWTVEAKARIVQESRQPSAVVSEVARRHGLSPQQLFGWRRDARGDLANGGDDACGLPRPTATPFVPIVVTTAADHPDVAGIAAGGGQIEIAIAGVLIRLRGEFDARLLRAVLQAVRATS
jgi:transposase